MNGLEYVLKLYNVTQQELADNLGIKQQNIDLWIRDKSRKIPKKHLPKLAEIFNIPEEYFQKELSYNDKEKIQMMKLYGINDESELGYEVKNEDWKPNEELDSLMEEGKQQYLNSYNLKRNELMVSIEKMLDLGMGETEYSAMIYIQQMLKKEEYLYLMRKFIDVLDLCEKDSEKSTLDRVLIGFELLKGKDLPEEYREDFYEGIFNEIKTEGYEFDTPMSVDKDAIEFIHNIRDMVEKEEKRTTKYLEEESKKISSIHKL